MSKKSLLFATIILLAVTIFWAIAFYEHIQAYNKMVQKVQEGIDRFGQSLREPFYLWGNGPLLAISGFIIAFAWIFIINEWWRMLKK